MNTVQLECFITVAEHLNFSRASEILRITQPAVSHQIRTLEGELGVKTVQTHPAKAWRSPQKEYNFCQTRN